MIMAAEGETVVEEGEGISEQDLPVKSVLKTHHNKQLLLYTINTLYRLYITLTGKYTYMMHKNTKHSVNFHLWNHFIVIIIAVVLICVLCVWQYGLETSRDCIGFFYRSTPSTTASSSKFI